jgi:hypothetical protein
MARGSIATESLRRRGFHLETWVSRPLLALRICAPLGLSRTAHSLNPAQARCRAMSIPMLRAKR